MSWSFSRALVEEYSLRKSTDTAPFAPSKLNRTVDAFCCDAKTKENSRLSRFGMIFGLLTESFGKELLTSFREVFRVKIFQPLGKGKGSPAKNRRSGSRCSASFGKFDRNSRSWRTPTDLFGEDSTLSSKDWPRAGSMRNGSCWERTTSALRISGSDAGFLVGTLTTRDTKRSRRYAAGRTPNPSEFVPMYPIPTLTTKGLDGGSHSRATAIKRGMYPTLTCQDAKNNGGPSQMVRNPRPLNALAGGKLNPEWCEWFMGFPVGWTELKPLETPKSRSVPPRRSKSSSKGSTNTNDTLLPN